MGEKSPFLKRSIIYQFLIKGSMFLVLGPTRVNLQRIFSDDLVFNLEAILISKYGPHLRHRMAHGLLEYEDFSRSEVPFLWWLTIRICFKNLWKDGV